VKD
jgi:hypothetical protein